MPSPEPAARSYLDHAACAPVRPEVADQIARDIARATAGRANPAALGVDPHEALFTSGGTEADGLVVLGRVLAARAAGVGRPHLVVSPVEHPAVLDSARRAGALGAELTLLDVDAAGRVAPGDAGRAVEPGRTALVSVMTANNETGLVQDVAGLVAAVRERTGPARPGESGWVPVHSDAVAAVGRVDVDMSGWGLDAMTVSGHKLGPRWAPGAGGAPRGGAGGAHGRRRAGARHQVGHAGRRRRARPCAAPWGARRRRPTSSAC